LADRRAVSVSRSAVTSASASLIRRAIPPICSMSAPRI
jgi:hypothetical protein